MAAFKNTFNSADDNGDRKLNKDEFFDLIKKSGEKKTDNQIECLVSTKLTLRIKFCIPLSNTLFISSGIHWNKMTKAALISIRSCLYLMALGMIRDLRTI